MRNFIRSASCFLALTLCFTGGQAQNPRKGTTPARPDIVIIVPDDLGWADVGYNGSFIRTPNIDALARSGVRLGHHYVMPTCTPTRVALMTGKYPSRYGVLSPAYGEVIYRDEPTLASILKDNGYATAIAGKWHMGSPPYTPTKYGFQSSYGYFDGQIDPYTHAYKDGRRSWHRNDVLVDEVGHATDLITDEAVRVIREERDKPLLLYVTYSVPHYPLDEPEAWTSLYDGMNLLSSHTLFAASVTHMDAGIGKIIRALDETGKRNHTLVLFISDNGGQQRWASDTEYHGRYADRPHLVLGNNFPLRGWKVDLYEGGIRVPAIANWPGHLAPGTADFPMHVVDWLPTICRLTGSEKALKQHAPDGRDIWAQLTGSQTADSTRRFYWKTPQGSAVRDGAWKLIVHNDGRQELFNVETDFRELRDMSTHNPEKVAALMKLLATFSAGDGQKR